MEGFYEQLITALESSGGDIWTETVLDGDHVGEKRLLVNANMMEKISVTGGLCDTSEAASKAAIEAASETAHSPRIYRERVGRTPKLVICGGGHVSMPIIRMGKMLGFTVTVLEDRPKFADNARVAGADTVVCDTFSAGLSQIRGDSDTWFVIVTRGHRYDTECLQAILNKTYAYVGMMGSRRRVAIVKDQLEEQGIAREVLEAVHTPIGLKIGAQTPEEIAVSVMAEIIQVKNGRDQSGGYSRELLDAIAGCVKETKPEKAKKAVLATIVSRKGSAPRDVGTKMLIMEEGMTVDTIGGGCVESEIMQKALLMMRAGKPEFQICRVDMTTEAAEDEGMVCGGVVEVILERVC